MMNVKCVAKKSADVIFVECIISQTNSSKFLPPSLTSLFDESAEFFYSGSEWCVQRNSEPHPRRIGH